MSRLGNFDPADVSVIVGATPIDGFAPGTFITAERNEESFTLTVGSSGDATRSKSNNNSGRITLTLLQSSPSNAVLSALSATDEASPAGDGVVPVLIKDNQSGASIAQAGTAWIVQPASQTYQEGDDPGREWILETNNLKLFSSGNLTP